ncbi:glycosyltransferase family 9 protein [Verrucomicrobia bacterium]|nr:glycosyltransferase family 9 protein [Verrucomicrobiota bacterium]
MKILILKPSSLGDVIQALPVLRHLRRAYPDAEIRWWIAEGLAPLLEGDPDLDGVIPFARGSWFRPRETGKMLGQIAGLRGQHYDWVIDLQGLFRSGLFAWLSKGSHVIGLENLKEGAPAFFDQSVPRPSSEAHAVDWYLSVLDVMGVPREGEIDWLPERHDISDPIKRAWNLSEGPLISLVPGARWKNKRWPVSYFQELVLSLAQSHPDCRFAILGGAGDHEMGDQIAAISPTRCIDLTGKTDLLQLIEWVRYSSLLVTNDTGPMHVGAALNTPMVSIFGPTKPSHTGPYGMVDSVLQEKLLPCVPCMKSSCREKVWQDCLVRVTPAMTLAAVARELSKQDGA